MLCPNKLMAFFTALIAVFATAITIRHADKNTIKDLTEQTDSNPSLLRLLAEKKEENSTVVNFAADGFS